MVVLELTIKKLMDNLGNGEDKVCIALLDQIKYTWKKYISYILKEEKINNNRNCNKYNLNTDITDRIYNWYSCIRENDISQIIRSVNLGCHICSTLHLLFYWFDSYASQTKIYHLEEEGEIL